MVRIVDRNMPVNRIAGSALDAARKGGQVGQHEVPDAQVLLVSSHGAGAAEPHTKVGHFGINRFDSWSDASAASETLVFRNAGVS